MTRPAPTQAQYHQAKRLIARIGQLETGVANLKRLLPAAKTAAEANARQRFERLSFTSNASNLAGIVELRRHTDPATVATIDREYQSLLTRMYDGYKSFQGPHIPPHKVDFHALKQEGRCYLLGPFLDLSVGGSFAALDLDRSSPAQGQLVYVLAHGAVDLTKIRPHLPDICGWLGGDYELTDSSVNTFTLTRRSPLPNTIPFQASFLQDGHLFLGVSLATRRPHQVPISDLSHFLITGTVGMGKSIALASIMRSLIHSLSAIHHVYCVDPGGIAFARYAGLSPKITTHSKPEDFAAIAAQLTDLMEQREAQLGAARREKFTTDFVFLIIDEWPAYGTAEGTDKKSKEAHGQFMKHVLALAKRGRKSGIRLILTTQVPTEQDIAPALRAALPGVLAFRMPLVAHASNVFQDMPNLPADPRTLARGRALYRGTTGEVAYVQFPLIAAPGEPQ
jgi:hypothetical protein